MSVLKDASSTALYGSRGANGVILITTKRKYNPKVSLTSTLGFAGNAVPLHKMVGSDRYMQLNWEALKNTNQYVSLQTPAVAGANASTALVPRLGYNPYAATPVDANGNLTTTNKKVGYRLI
jgi:TonB-dependent SusC/RagA subfamily outer membrane receptor